MNTITTYHAGDYYTLEPLGGPARTASLILCDGVRIGQSAARELLVFGPGFARGVPVRLAAQLGWCRVEEGPSSPSAQ